MTASRSLNLTLAALLLAGGVAMGREAGGDLSQAGVQAAFQILRQDYIRRQELDFATQNRAA